MPHDRETQSSDTVNEGCESTANGCENAVRDPSEQMGNAISVLMRAANRLTHDNKNLRIALKSANQIIGELMLENRQLQERLAKGA